MLYSLFRTGLLFCFAASFLPAAQLFSVGIKAGVPLTDAFSSDTFTSGTQTVRSFSNSTEFLIGPTGEIHLPLGLSVEADALYRPLSYATQVQPSGPVNSGTISSWEFPILAKLHVPFPILAPYIEGGPSFRAVGGAAGNYLSHSGIALGIGIELHISRVRIGPELRYTHWAGDASGAAANGFISNQNQGEFLVGFSF